MIYLEEFGFEDGFDLMVDLVIELEFEGGLIVDLKVDWI